MLDQIQKQINSRADLFLVDIKFGVMMRIGALFSAQKHDVWLDRFPVFSHPFRDGEQERRMSVVSQGNCSVAA